MPSSIVRLRAALRAYRPLAHANLVVPLLVGELRAHAEGAIDLREALALHAFAVPLQGMIVFANDLADAGTDGAERSLVSGGSGVLGDGTASPADLRRWLAVSTGLCFAWGVGAWSSPAPLLALAPPLAAAAIAAYELPPIRAGRSPLGALVQTLAMGVALPSMAYYAATGRVGGFEAAALVAPYAFASHLLTALPDEVPDRACGKRTLVVVLGARRAAYVAAAALAVVCGVGLAVGGYSRWVLGFHGLAIGSLLGLAGRPPETVRERGLASFAVLTLASLGLLAAAARWARG